MPKPQRWLQFLIKILIKLLMSTVILLGAVKKNKVLHAAGSNNLMYQVQIKKYSKTFLFNNLG